MRRIHVDQGRLATNRTHGTDHAIVRVDDDRRRPVAWGGTIEIRCGGCGQLVASFVQAAGDRAHVELEDAAELEARPDERREPR